MSTLEAAHINMRLWGVAIIGLPVTELCQLFKLHNCAAPEISEQSDWEILYHYDDCGCNVYVEEGVVTSIQMGVLFDEAGENEQWPSITD